MSLTKDDLVERAQLEVARWGGPPISQRTVSDWIDEGLLPKAEPIGRGRGSNPLWVYPDEAAERVVAIVKARRFGRQRADALRLQLWSRGHDLPLCDIRSALAHELKRFVVSFHRLTRWSFDHREPRNRSDEAIQNYRRSMGALDPDIEAVGIVLSRAILLRLGSFVIHGLAEQSQAALVKPGSDGGAMASFVERGAGLFANPEEEDGSGLQRLPDLSDEQLEFGRAYFRLIEPSLGIGAALLGIHIPVLADKINRLERKISNSFYLPVWHTPFLATCILTAPWPISEIFGDVEHCSVGASAAGF